MSLPAEGWFPDPQDDRLQRWWDGRSWSHATRPAPAASLAPEVVAAASIVTEPAAPRFSVPTGPAFAAESRVWAHGSGVRATSTGSIRVVRRLCPAALTAVVFAMVSIVSDPFAVFSVLSIVAGVIAIVRPRTTGTWRVASVSGAASAIVLATATGLIAAIETVRVVLPGLLGS